MPGAGKTMMAAITIDHICTTATNDRIGLAYVFCNYKSQADQSALGLLSSLLRQFIEGQLDFARPLVEMYNQHLKRKTRPSLNEVTAALETVCLGYSHVYIIVDALDECVDDQKGGNSSRAQFIREMRALQAAVDLRLLFTSRPIPEITQLFKSDTMLEVRATKEDIQQFVASHISTMYNAHLQAEIIDKIATAADGM
jgi:hypothetical protein